MWGLECYIVVSEQVGPVRPKLFYPSYATSM